MTPNLITYCMANRRGKSGAVTDFIFLGSKFIADSDCSHKIKRWLLLGKKVMTNLDNVLKSRDITLQTKVCMVFPIVIDGIESWTATKAEHQKMDPFELWCWRRLKESLSLYGDQPSKS